MSFYDTIRYNMIYLILGIVLLFAASRLDDFFGTQPIWENKKPETSNTITDMLAELANEPQRTYDAKNSSSKGPFDLHILESTAQE